MSSPPEAESGRAVIAATNRFDPKRDGAFCFDSIASPRRALGPLPTIDELEHGLLRPICRAPWKGERDHGASPGQPRPPSNPSAPLPKALRAMFRSPLMTGPDRSPLPSSLSADWLREVCITRRRPAERLGLVLAGGSPCRRVRNRDPKPDPRRSDAAAARSAGRQGTFAAALSVVAR